jgi:hypothetical protein
LRSLRGAFGGAALYLVTLTGPARLAVAVEKRADGPMKHKPFARQLQRVRKICLSLPDATEKLSHGEPTFFVKKRVFAMFSNNHHHDGHVAVWLPAPPGVQETLIEEAPLVYYRPPYVGVSGWIGVELDQVSDDALDGHIRGAWQLIVKKDRSRRVK